MFLNAIGGDSFYTPIYLISTMFNDLSSVNLRRAAQTFRSDDTPLLNGRYYRSSRYLYAIWGKIAIGVADIGIRFIGDYFLAVLQSVVVGVGIRRIRAGVVCGDVDVGDHRLPIERKAEA